jgi:hypothetical protein
VPAYPEKKGLFNLTKLVVGEFSELLLFVFMTVSL